MGKMITRLTAEQKARFPEFVEKWIRIGLSTEPADRGKAERAIKGMYGLAKLREPRVIWLPCPLSGAMAAATYAATAGVRLTGQRSAVDSAVGSAVGRKYTREQIDEAIRLCESRKTVTFISKLVGMHPSSVLYHLLKNGLDPFVRHTGKTRFRKRRAFTAAEDERLIELSKVHQNIMPIARIMGRARTSVRMRLLLLGAAEDRGVSLRP